MTDQISERERVIREAIRHKGPSEVHHDHIDTIVIGGGPNGLTAAAYLARAGQNVVICEKRYEETGGLWSESLGTPFRHNIHATYMMLAELMPPYQDFNLKQTEDVHFIRPEAQMTFNAGGEQSITFYTDPEKTADSIAEVSEADAERFQTFHADMEVLCHDIAIPAIYRPPMSKPEQEELWEQTDLGEQMLEIRDRSPVEILDHYGFENPHVRGALLYLAIQWGANPEEPGLGFQYPLYVHRMQNAALVKGGTHTLGSALDSRVEAHDGELLEWAEVTDILVEDGKATGVRLRDGREFEADCIISTLNLEQTFLDLLPSEAVPDSVKNVVDSWEWDQWSLFAINWGIRGDPPQFSRDREAESLLNVVGMPTEADVIEHATETMNKELPDEPPGAVTCMSTFDDLTARDDPAGYDLHAMKWKTWAPYDIDKHWDDVKEAYADACMQSLEEAAVETDNITLFRHPWSPLDIERRLSTMKKGSIKHGAYITDQMDDSRPSKGLSNTRTPIDNLYLGGASIYPGGMITLGPGYQVARVVAEDYDLEKWWDPPAYIQKARENDYVK